MKQDKIELILLPPADRKEVTEEDIAKTYTDIINLLLTK